MIVFVVVTAVVGAGAVDVVAWWLMLLLLLQSGVWSLYGAKLLKRTTKFSFLLFDLLFVEIVVAV